MRKVSRGRLALLVALAALAAAAEAATFKSAQLVRDIETSLVPASSNPRLVCGRDSNSTLVTVEDQTHTRLWRTNGTAASTALIKDFGNLDPYGDLQCIYAGTTGPQFLLLTDGPNASLLAVDAAATGVVEILRGTDGNWPALLGVAGLPVFSVPQPDGSTRLIASDGTVAGTTQIASLPADPTGFPAVVLHTTITMGSKVYFGARGDIWETNGSSAGTHLSVSLPATPAPDPYLHSFVQLGSRFLFARQNGDVSELWISDGTGPGTQLLAGFGADQDPRVLRDMIRASNGLAVFTVRDNANGNGNGQLWRTDGTAAGTVRISSAPDLEVYDVIHPLRAGGAVFQGITAAYGREPWFTDGTDSGTRLVKDITPGPNESFLLIMEAGAGVLMANVINYYDLWYTDGTPGGTWSLSAVEPRLSVLGTTALPFLALGTRFLFLTETPGAGPYTFRLWRLDPATRSVSLVREFDAPSEGAVGASISTQEPAHGVAVLATYDASRGFEPWATDGTAAGTTLIADLAPQVSNHSSSARSAFSLNGIELFYASTFAQGAGLWRTDGSTAGTTYLGRGAPIFGTFGVPSVQRNGSVIYPGVDPDGAVGLWRSDGTASGTASLQTFSVSGFGGFGGDAPAGCGAGFASLGNTFYFGVRPGVVGRLYRSDGTAGGTVEIGSFAGPTGTGQPACVLAAFGNELYFTAADPATGVGVLWRSNGLAGGHSRALSPSGATFQNVIAMRQAGSALYFTGSVAGIAGLWRIASQGAEPTQVMAYNASGINAVAPNGALEALDTIVLYPVCNIILCRLARSDGTAAGTFELTGPALPFFFQPWAYLVYGGKLLFQGGDANGVELWTTDGTAAGTRLVKDIIPGLEGSRPRDFIDFNGLAYFQFDVIQNGEQTTQLWRSDGTEAGTERVNSTPFIYGTVQNPPPQLLVRPPFGVAGDRLYFGASTLEAGTELFSVENEAPVTGIDSGTTEAGTGITVNVLGNDSDPDGTVVNSTLRIAQTPANGSTAVDGVAGTIRYTPIAGFSGSDSFTYRVADRQGRLSAPTAVNITVTAATVSGGGGSGGSGGSGNSGGGGALELFSLLGLGAWLAKQRRCRGTNAPRGLRV